jgi:protein-disulfide isomerase
MPPKPRTPTPKAAKPQAGASTSRRNQLLLVAGAVAVAAALIVASILLAGGGDDESGGTTASTTETNALLDGIPQQNVFLGSPQATVTMIEYADLQCPICRQYAQDFFPALVREYVRPGQVRMEFRGLAFIGADSEKALRFTLAAGDQNHLWDFQDGLYARQGEENSGWVTDELLREVGASIPGLDVDRVFADSESETVSTEIAQTQQQATEAEVPGTPWFFLQVGDAEPYAIQPGSLDEFRAALDDALDG